MPRFAAALVLALAIGAGAGRVHTQDAKDPGSVAPYVPTPWIIVDAIMALAEPKAGDVVVDLGSGDGRLVIEAVRRHGASRGLGVDIDASLVRLANDNAAKAGVADRVRFETKDLFATPVGDATLVTLYLLPGAVPRVETKLLAELAPGTRVISHDYPFPSWPAKRVVTMEVADKIPISGTTRTALYLYVVPARVAGSWDLVLDRAAPFALTLVQDAKGASGRIRVRDRDVPLSAVTVDGERIELALPAGIAGSGPVVLRGTVRGDAIEGGSGAPAWRAKRRS